MNNVAVAIASWALLLTACGGGKGGASGEIDPARTIESLTTDEARELCELSVAAQGGAGTNVVCDGFELVVQSVEDCTASVASATCTNTVAELNACTAALEVDTCAALVSAECEVLFACAS